MGGALLVAGAIATSGCSKTEARDHEHLIQAVQSGKLDASRRLLDRPDAKWSQEELGEALLSATVKTQPAMVELLLERGADTRTRDKFGRYPIWAAVYPSNHLKFATDEIADEYLETLRLFVEHGSPIDVYLAHACRLFALAPSDPQPTERERRTGLAAIELLCKARVDFEVQEGGSTPLQHAATKGDTAIAKILIGHGANVNSPTNGPSPLALATAAGHAEMVQLLREHGAQE